MKSWWNPGVHTACQLSLHQTRTSRGTLGGNKKAHFWPLYRYLWACTGVDRLTVYMTALNCLRYKSLHNHNTDWCGRSKSKKSAKCSAVSRRWKWSLWWYIVQSKKLQSVTIYYKLIASFFFRFWFVFCSINVFNLAPAASFFSFLACLTLILLGFQESKVQEPPLGWCVLLLYESWQPIVALSSLFVLFFCCFF